MAKSMTRKKNWWYVNVLSWQEGREGNIKGEDKSDINVATPAEFGGPQGRWSPEDLLVASVNSCIMTTFLHYQDKSDIDILSYSSTGQGELVYGDGGLSFNKIIIEAEIEVASVDDLETTRQNLQRAEDNCLISNALSCPVIVEPQVVAVGDEE